MPFITTSDTTEPFMRVKTVLDGTNYILTFEWNMRSGWYLGLSDANDSVIFQPKKLVADWDILHGCTDARRPPGRLAVIDLSGLGRRPEYDSFGTTHRIVYASLSDIAELAAV